MWEFLNKIIAQFLERFRAKSPVLFVVIAAVLAGLYITSQQLLNSDLIGETAKKVLDWSGVVISILLTFLQSPPAAPVSGSNSRE